MAGAVASSLGRIEGITLRNMRLDSLQADEKILDILRSCGADVSVAPADVSVRGDMPGDLQNISVTATGRRLKAFEVDATHCPICSRSLRCWLPIATVRAVSRVSDV